MSQSQPLLMTDFDYDLPEALIAQVPLEHRSESRLMVLDRTGGAVSHRSFQEFPSLLNPGDLVVLNDTRVIPARLHGHRTSGGRVEFLLLKRRDTDTWEALAKPAARLQIGETVQLDAFQGSATGTATILEKLSDGIVHVQLGSETDSHLEEFGEMPLPPYIHTRLKDQNRYQTVYARQNGSAAAPTAGLHFTRETFQELRDTGIEIAWVTLHVGLDTFRPVTEEDASKHHIHREWCQVPASTIRKIRETRDGGHRVVAVGTTTARTLETWGNAKSTAIDSAFETESQLYITPGYQWKVVDALLTNFHLPKSTLLLMVSALASRDHILNAYHQAIQEKYRFFSFGDAMFIT